MCCLNCGYNECFYKCDAVKQNKNCEDKSLKIDCPIPYKCPYSNLNNSPEDTEDNTIITDLGIKGVIVSDKRSPV